MSIYRHYVLAAGSAGGHVVPAHALARELMLRGHRVALITDESGVRIPGLFEHVQHHVLPDAPETDTIAGMIAFARAVKEARGTAMRLYSDFAPSAVVGLGGFPALPALMAAHGAGIPTVLHEANAVMSRTSRYLAGAATVISTGYAQPRKLASRHGEKVHYIGNPVREPIVDLREEPYPALSGEGVMRLLVVGEGATDRLFAQVVPAGLGMLPLGLRRRLQVTQQCHPDDIETVRSAYAALEIPADLSTYVEDLPEKLGWAHLVIARAGASTIAELTTAGRPAIIVPLPTVRDNHQYHNARDIARAGGARIIPQTELSFTEIADADIVGAGDEQRHLRGRFTPQELCRQVQKLALEPDGLRFAAERARGCGRPDAARDLADLVESIGLAPQMPGAVRETVPEMPLGALAGAAA